MGVKRVRNLREHQELVSAKDLYDLCENACRVFELIRDCPVQLDLWQLRLEALVLLNLEEVG